MIYTFRLVKRSLLIPNLTFPPILKTKNITNVQRFYPLGKKLRKNTFDRVCYQATLKLQVVQFICGWVKKKILDLKRKEMYPSGPQFGFNLHNYQNSKRTLSDTHSFCLASCNSWRSESRILTSRTRGSQDQSLQGWDKYIYIFWHYRK